MFFRQSKRLTSLEILEKLFPAQKRQVLEIALNGCNGDVVRTIEHLLILRDHAATMSALSEQAESGLLNLMAANKQDLKQQQHLQKVSPTFQQSFQQQQQQQQQQRQISPSIPERQSISPVSRLDEQEVHQQSEQHQNSLMMKDAASTILARLCQQQQSNDQQTKQDITAMMAAKLQQQQLQQSQISNLLAVAYQNLLQQQQQQQQQPSGIQSLNPTATQSVWQSSFLQQQQQQQQQSILDRFSHVLLAHQQSTAANQP